MLGGQPFLTAAYLVGGEGLALIDPGAETSAETVGATLNDAGIGPADLDWIVLTHIHLDHCGAAGRLARAFPRATFLVHPRGARHLAEPEKLVAGTRAVHGEDLFPIYGGLDPIDPERIVIAEDDHTLDLGAGTRLRVIHTPGHARHHASILDEGTGNLFAGDAIGVSFHGGDLYPALPPNDVDITAGLASIELLRGLGAPHVFVTHFAAVPDTGAAFDTATRQWARLGELALGALDGGRQAIADAIEQGLAMTSEVSDPEDQARWTRLRWVDNNVDGMMGWAIRERDAAGGA